MSTPVLQASPTAAATQGVISPRMLTAALIVLAALSWGFLPDFTVVILSYIGLDSLVAAGLVLLTGVGGMTSFGQAAFVGIGAYATAWVCTSPQATQFFGSAVGAAAAGAIANLSGFSGGLSEASARTTGLWVFASILPVALAGVWAAWKLTAHRS